MNALRQLPLLLLLISTVLITACNRGDDEESSETIKVSGPANEILQKEGNLHVFSVNIFEQKPNPFDDIMLLTIDSFAPSISNIEPEDEEDDQTLNRLKYKQLSWDELHLQWTTVDNPLHDSRYQKKRSYRVLDNGVLQTEKEQLNQPIYETIDDNIFERQLAICFVWDFSRYGDVRSDRDVSYDRLDDYETLYGYPVLDHVNIWADINLETIRFSEGAMIYAASRSVATDTVIVESVFQEGEFTLVPTRIAQGLIDLKTALDSFTPNARLKYQFTVDYDQHRTFYMSFDSALEKAYLYSTADGAVTAETDLLLSNDKPYAEINTQALTSELRQQLNLPAYFNPVIIGPSDGDYFYGKRYVKTTASNRLLLQPIFFLNNPAKNDVENTFKRWRQQEDKDRR